MHDGDRSLSPKAIVYTKVLGKVDQTKGISTFFTGYTEMQETLGELYPRYIILVVSFESICARYINPIIYE